MFTLRARLCFETLADPRCLSSWCWKKMCQQTCHTHLQSQLLGEAESSRQHVTSPRDSDLGDALPHLSLPGTWMPYFTPSPLTSHLSPLVSQSQWQLCIFHLIFPSNPLSKYSSRHIHFHLLQTISNYAAHGTHFRYQLPPGHLPNSSTLSTKLLMVCLLLLQLYFLAFVYCPALD